MLKINYNGKSIDFEENQNGFQLLKVLGNSELSKDVVAIKSNGVIKDLRDAITTTTTVEFVEKNSVDGVAIVRHSCAHILASAVKHLFKDYNVKMTIGPAIENGFYYDFDTDYTFSEKDFEAIENEMNKIIKDDIKITKQVISRKDALEMFKDNPYKIELINDIEEGQDISIYTFGDFVDLCSGPHVPNVKLLKNFKISKVAGAYWRGDSNNKMLQRIYAYCFDTKENLDAYLQMLKEAEKRDHRKICKAMDLCHFEPDYAPGAPFFHPKGLYLYNKLINYIRKRQDANNYQEIITPRVMDRVLWEISGHWEKYGAHNYSGKMEDGKQFCIKPMNCPGCILTYKQGIKSYRDLPLKISEFGKVNRYEASGSLFGLLRVREFTQDDAHLFCTAEQMNEECKKLIKFVLDTYHDLGFDNVRIKLSTRPENRIGSEEIWDKSEKALADALTDMKLQFTIFEGEGAFYGPKLEFVLKDSIGRDWQIGTIQLDMNLPARFEMSYIDENGQKQQPIMFHRAILGSIERFMGILIEETEGKFPLWMNPLQIAVANIAEDSREYGEQIVKILKENDFQVIGDFSNEKISYKVRELSIQKIPYIFTVGKKEMADKTVSVRIIGNEETKTYSLEEIMKILKKKIENKDRDFELR